MANILIFNEDTGEWERNTADVPVIVDSNIEITDTDKGFVVKAPNGNRWRIGVDDSGNLVTVNIDS